MTTRAQLHADAPENVTPGTLKALSRLERRLYRLTMLDHVLSRARGEDTPRYGQRARTVDALWARSPLKAPRQPEPVPVLSGPLTPEAFAAASDGFRKPVLIRGFAREAPAVQRWTPEHLAQRLRGERCTVVEMDDAAMASPHASRRVLRELDFEDFIDRIDDEPLYLHNATAFASQRPELLGELPLQALLGSLAGSPSGWDGLFATGLFVGGERVFSNLHCAPGGNFFVQVYGEKTWTLIDPALSPYLFPIVSRPFNHCLSAFGSYRGQAARPDCPIHRLPRLKVTLRPGDLLYNPPWWWHEVENHGATIGCAIRHLPPPLAASPSWANHRLFSATSVYPQLWSVSALSWARHRALGSGAPLRETLNPMLATALNRARGREA